VPSRSPRPRSRGPAAGVTTLNNPAADGDWASGVFSTAAQDAVNKTGKTQLRVCFSTDDDNDTTADYIGFYSKDNATSTNWPVLNVTYQPAL
jgi:hypothetical protein